MPQEELQFDFSGVDTLETEQPKDTLEFDFSELEFDFSEIEQVQEPETNIVEDIAMVASGIPAGVVSAYEQYARAGRLTGLVDDETVELAKSLSRSLPTGSGVSGTLKSGIESTIQSVLGGIPGALVGALGGPAGSVGGFAVSAGTIFSLAEYDRFMDELGENILSGGGTQSDVEIAKEKFQTEAIISAVAEGGLEAASNVIQAQVFNLIGGKAVTGAAKNALKDWLTKFVKSYAAEASTELVTAKIQISQREDAGIPTPDFASSFADILGTVAVQSAIMSGGSVAFDRVRSNKELKEADKIFKENSDAIDKLANNEPVNITPETEDDIFKAYALVKQSGVSRARVIKDGINNYASQELDKLQKDIEQSNKQVISGDLSIDEVDIESKQLRLQKLSAVLENSDFGLIQNAIKNIQEGDFVVEPNKFAQEAELLETIDDLNVEEVQEQVAQEIQDPIQETEELQFDESELIQSDEAFIEEQRAQEQELLEFDETELQEQEPTEPAKTPKQAPSFSNQEQEDAKIVKAVEKEKKKLDDLSVSEFDALVRHAKRVGMDLQPIFGDAFDIEFTRKNKAQKEAKQIRDRARTKSSQNIAKFTKAPTEESVIKSHEKGFTHIQVGNNKPFPISPIIERVNKRKAKKIQSQIRISKGIQKPLRLPQTEKEGKSKPQIKEPVREKEKFGAKNKVFTKEKLDKAFERLKNIDPTKPKKSGLDQETLQDLIDVAGFYAEGGLRKSSEIIDKVASQVGEWVREHSDAIISGLRANKNINIEQEEQDINIFEDKEFIDSDKFQELSDREAINELSDQEIVDESELTENPEQGFQEETDPIVVDSFDNNNEPTTVNNQETDNYQAQVDRNSTIDNAAKLSNYIESVNNKSITVQEIVNDSKKLKEKEFVNKYNKFQKINISVKGWNMRKVYAFAKDYYVRSNRRAFVFSKKSGVGFLEHNKILEHPDMPSEWQHTSVFDAVALSRKWNFFWSAGDYVTGKFGKLKRSSVYKISKRNKLYQKQKADAMWKNGQFVLVMRSAQGKSEMWVKNLFPNLERSQARKKTLEKVYQEVGMSSKNNIITDANALKRSQIVLATGPVARVTNKLGRKTQAQVIPENRFGFYNQENNTVQEFTDKKQAQAEANKSDSSVKNLHDGAIYVTQNYLNKYLDALGIENKQSGGFKSFIWMKTAKGTVAGKGFFFVAKSGSFEDKHLRRHKIDMLIYEDASKLDYPHNQTVELHDFSIRFKRDNLDLHSIQTFTRSQLPMMPLNLQGEYNNMIGNLIFDFEAENLKIMQVGGVSKFLKNSLGFTRSAKQDDLQRMLEAGADIHPLIFGVKGSNNPFKQSYISFVRDKILKMPRTGFHSDFKPSDSNLKLNEIEIPAEAMANLKRQKNFKIGDNLMIARSPLIKADSVMILKVVGTHKEGNVIKMNDTQYAVMSTGDFDGDEGAAIVPMKFEEEFYREIQGFVGDISLDQYKPETPIQESILNEKQFHDMINRNSAGKDLIGSVANTFQLYHIFAHNKKAFTLRGSNGIASDIKEGKLVNSPQPHDVIFIPKNSKTDFDYLNSHDLIAQYHLSATDQAKEDALFNIAEKRTGTTPDNVSQDENAPITSLLMELFDIYEVSGQGWITNFDSKRNYIKTMSDPSDDFNPFDVFRDMLSSFNRDPDTGGSWTYDDMINNIEKYTDFVEGNGFGNTQIEKLLMNISDTALDFGFMQVKNSPEYNTVMDSHKQALQKLENKYAPDSNQRRKLMPTLISAVRKWSDKKSTYTEAAENAKDLIKRSGLNKSQQNFLSYILFESNSKDYETLANTKVTIATDEFLKDYFETFNKTYKLNRDKLSKMSVEERTGIKQEVLPQPYRYKPCYKNG